MESANLDQGTETIVFDTNSGISLEEQQELLENINAMAVGSRIVTEAPVTKAAKKDFSFPLLVNVGALLVLGLGSLGLSFFYKHDEQIIRESSSFLGVTERVLIQEIRRETTRLINEKEKQINDILSKLFAADEEYRLLESSVEILTEAQRERAAMLLAMQEEYRSTLFYLEEEKARILEDSRMREAVLRAQAEAKVKELSSIVEQSETSLSAAMEELKQLETEQERLARIENQMRGFYRTLDDLVAGDRMLEASRTLAAMKDFLGTPMIQAMQQFQTRRQVHLSAISAWERLISAGSGAVNGESSEELKSQNAALLQRTASLERDLAAFNSQGSEQTRIISEYVDAINELEIVNMEQQQALNRQDSEIQNLMTEVLEKDEQVSGLNNDLAVLRSQYNELQRRTDAALRAFNEEPPE